MDELTVVGLYKMVIGDISVEYRRPPDDRHIREKPHHRACPACIPIAILSINLGVLNSCHSDPRRRPLTFLPHRRHLRKPLGERQRELAQQVGLVLLVGVMIFAFWNDLERIFFSH